VSKQVENCEHPHDGHKQRPCKVYKKSAPKETRRPSDFEFPSGGVEGLSRADDECQTFRSRICSTSRKCMFPPSECGCSVGGESNVRCSGQVSRCRIRATPARDDSNEDLCSRFRGGDHLSVSVSKVEEFGLTLGAIEPHLGLVCRRRRGDGGFREAVVETTCPHWHHWGAEQIKRS
jgi:hypothetical protein